MKVFGYIVVIKRSGLDYTSFPLTTTNCSIGRNQECDIRVQLPTVSKQHCLIKVDSSGIAYINNASLSHPTLLNNKALEHKKEHLLQHKDLICIADRHFRWEYPEGCGYKETFINLSSNKSTFATPSKRKKSSPSKGSTKHSVVENLLSEERGKRVSFGPYLSPEQYDKKLPPSTPIRKGQTPLELDIEASLKKARKVPRFSLQNPSNPEDTNNGLLKRKSPTPVKPKLAKSLGLFVGSKSKSPVSTAPISSTKKTDHDTQNYQLNLDGSDHLSEKELNNSSKKDSKGKKRKISRSPTPSRKKMKISTESQNQTPQIRKPKSAKKSVKKVKTFADALKIGIKKRSLIKAKTPKRTALVLKRKLRTKGIANIDSTDHLSEITKIPNSFNFGIKSTGHAESPAPIIIHKKLFKTPKVYKKGKKLTAYNQLSDGMSPDLSGLRQILKSPKSKSPITSSHIKLENIISLDPKILITPPKNADFVLTSNKQYKSTPVLIDRTRSLSKTHKVSSPKITDLKLSELEIPDVPILFSASSVSKTFSRRTVSPRSKLLNLSAGSPSLNTGMLNFVSVSDSLTLRAGKSKSKSIRKRPNSMPVAIKSPSSPSKLANKSKSATMTKRNARSKSVSSTPLHNISLDNTQVKGGKIKKVDMLGSSRSVAKSPHRPITVLKTPDKFRLASKSLGKSRSLSKSPVRANSGLKNATSPNTLSNTLITGSKSVSKSPGSHKFMSKSTGKSTYASKSPVRSTSISKSPRTPRPVSKSTDTPRSVSMTKYHHDDFIQSESVIGPPKSSQLVPKSPVRSKSQSKSPGRHTSILTPSNIPQTISKSPGQSQSLSNSPRRPKSISKSAGRSISKSPSKLNSVSASKLSGRSKSLAKSLGRSKSLSKLPGRSKSLSKSPGRSKSISKSPGRSKSISKSLGKSKSKSQSPVKFISAIKSPSKAKSALRALGSPKSVLKSPSSPISAAKSLSSSKSVEKSPSSSKSVDKSPSCPKSKAKSPSSPKSKAKSQSNPKSVSKSLGRSVLTLNTSKLTSKSPATTKFASSLPITPKSVAKSPGRSVLTLSTSKSLSKSPGSPKFASKSPGTPKFASKSPGTPKFATKSPNTPKLASKSPGTPKFASKSPGTPKFVSKSLGTPKLASKSPDTPKLASKSPGTPKFASKSPGTPKFASKSPGTPKFASKSPGTPKFASKSPGTPKFASKSPGTPKFASKSPSTPKFASKSPGTPKFASKSPGTPKFASKLPSFPESLSKSSGRSILTVSIPKAALKSPGTLNFIPKSPKTPKSVSKTSGTYKSASRNSGRLRSASKNANLFKSASKPQGKVILVANASLRSKSVSNSKDKSRNLKLPGMPRSASLSPMKSYKYESRSSKTKYAVEKPASVLNTSGRLSRSVSRMPKLPKPELNIDSPRSKSKTLHKQQSTSGTLGSDRERSATRTPDNLVSVSKISRLIPTQAISNSSMTSGIEQVSLNTLEKHKSFPKTPIEQNSPTMVSSNPKFNSKSVRKLLVTPIAKTNDCDLTQSRDRSSTPMTPGRIISSAWLRSPTNHSVDKTLRKLSILSSSSTRKLSRVSMKNNSSYSPHSFISDNPFSMSPSSPVAMTPQSGRKSRASVRMSPSCSPVTPPPNPSNLKSCSRSKQLSQSMNISTGTNKTTFDFSSLKSPNITADNFISPLGTPAPKGTPESIDRLTQQDSYEQLDIPIDSDITTYEFESQATPAISRDQLVSPLSSSHHKDAILNSMRKRYTVKSPLKDCSVTNSIQKLFENKDHDLPVVSNLFESGAPAESNNSDSETLNLNSKSVTPVAGYSDVVGVRRLLRTPKEIVSPAADYSDVRGLKKLLSSPYVNKSPKSDFSDVQGIKRLMKTPRDSKSLQKTNCNDFVGLKQLMRTPLSKVLIKDKSKEICQPNSDYDLIGLRKLLKSPSSKLPHVPDYTEVGGIKDLLKSSRLSKHGLGLEDLEGVRELLAVPVTPINSPVISASKDFKKFAGTPGSNTKLTRSKLNAVSPVLEKDIVSRPSSRGKPKTTHAHIGLVKSSDITLTRIATTKDSDSPSKKSKTPLTNSDHPSEVKPLESELQNEKLTKIDKDEFEHSPKKTRRGRRAAINSPLIVEFSKNTPRKAAIRGRKKKSISPDKVETLCHGSPAENIITPKKLTRGRKKKSPLAVKIASTPNIGSPSENIITPKKVTRGRKKKSPLAVKLASTPNHGSAAENIITPKKLTRGRKKKSPLAVELASTPNIRSPDENIITPKKLTRGRKKKSPLAVELASTPHIGSPADNIIMPKKLTRGRKKKSPLAVKLASTPHKTPKKTTRGRKKKSLSPEGHTSTTCIGLSVQNAINETPKKVLRGRKKNCVSPLAVESIQSIETPKMTSRGRKRKSASSDISLNNNDKIPKKTTRGRKKKSLSPEGHTSTPCIGLSVQNEISETPKKALRGRKKNCVLPLDVESIRSIETTKMTSQGKKRKSALSDISLNNEVETKSKRITGTKNTKALQESTILSPEREVIKEARTAKTKKIKLASPVLSTSPKKVTRTLRSRR